MEVFGYQPGKARVFDLKAGEKLPEGWADKPFPGDHPHDAEAGIVAEPVKPVEPPKVVAKKPIDLPKLSLKK